MHCQRYFVSAFLLLSISVTLAHKFIAPMTMLFIFLCLLMSQDSIIYNYCGTVEYYDRL